MTNDFTEPTCPTCHADLLDSATWKRMSITVERDEKQDFLVLFCATVDASSQPETHRRTSVVIDTDNGWAAATPTWPAMYIAGAVPVLVSALLPWWDGERAFELTTLNCISCCTELMALGAERMLR